jgi:hypothetical protein
MARLCCKCVYTMLLRGSVYELGLSAMSVTEVSAVLGSAGVDLERCLLVTAADSQLDAIKLI